MLIKKFYVSLILSASSISFFANSVSECKNKCNAEFGTKIGINNITKAFSNCNDKCISDAHNYIRLKNNKKIYTGMKWQCVEYARRWLIENKGYTFDSVTYAYQIWNFNTVKNIYTNRLKKLKKYKNLETKVKPEVGDMLIQDNTHNVAGHISIITSVGKDSITIAEQNYTNNNWKNKSSSRHLKLKRNKDGNYLVHDKTIIGWMRV